MKRLDLVGQKFGRLIVLKFDKVKNGKSYWRCKCDCGIVKSIRGISLKSEITKSCSCLQQELKTTHKMTKSREYKTWQAMKERCLNKNISSYSDYGGRGITVCKRWLKFENFYSDLGKRPIGTSLDRLDNNGNYEPKNCAYRSAKDQCRNQRSNVNITYKGKTQCLAGWSEELEIKYTTLYHRIKKHNWSTERALETPV